MEVKFMFCAGSLPSFAQKKVQKPPSLAKGRSQMIIIFGCDMKPRKIHNRPETKIKRIQLRKNLTSAEAFLWNELKSKKLEGRKFRRQHSIGNFIIDFYCAKENLIIELDGEVHNNAIAIVYDEKRTAFFNENGFNVVRCENKMVFENLPSVLQEIRENFRNKIE
ncbi:MAG: endonuclease domain-containing protein [Arenibacter sp.]|jgi:very-short-patch-repair endonuclease